MWLWANRCAAWRRATQSRSQFAQQCAEKGRKSKWVVGATGSCTCSRGRGTQCVAHMRRVSKKILSSCVEQASSSDCRQFGLQKNEKKNKKKKRKLATHTHTHVYLAKMCVWQLSVTFMATFSTSLKRQVINLLTHSNRLAGQAARGLPLHPSPRLCLTWCTLYARDLDSLL